MCGKGRRGSCRRTKENEGVTSVLVTVKEENGFCDNGGS